MTSHVASVAGELPTEKEGVVLKPLSFKDAVDFYEAMHESREEIKSLLMYPDAQFSIDEVKQLVKNIVYNRETKRSLAFGIFQGGELVGYIDLMNLKSETEEPEVGFWIKTSQAGKGLATIATNAIVSYGFNKLGLERIVLGCKPDNLATKRVAEKCGFKFEKLYTHPHHGEAELWVRKKD